MTRMDDAQSHHSPEPGGPSALPKIAILIPALNEEASIGAVIAAIGAAQLPGLAQIIVANNGSDDATADRARAVGAEVVFEPQRGYGAACLAAMESLAADIAIVVFMDADGSDVASEAHGLVSPIVSGEADLVIGSRALGRAEPGALTLPQRFGNWLATLLMRVIWRARFTDLGPFRAIRRTSLDAIGMKDRDYGWTVEMQVKAVRAGLRCTERPADYRKRVGTSKISGTVRGVVLAGTKILYVIAREALRGSDTDRTARPR
jgi:glycosyltransferase involved in cell wall biosynthesis